MDAPRTPLWCPWARVEDHPRRGRGRITAPPWLTWRIIKTVYGVAVKDDRSVDVRRLELKLGEGLPGGLSIEAPDDMGVLIRAQRVRVNGCKAVVPKLPGYGTLGL